jgi:hypothetical protein
MTNLSLLFALFFPPLNPALGLPLEAVHFLPIQRFEEKEGLPPKLFAVFEVDCGQKFLHVVRHEVEDKNHVTHIYLGGLAQDVPESSCVGKSKEVIAAAGTTFSGRAFQVEAIQSYRMKVTGQKSEPEGGGAGKKK